MATSSEWNGSSMFCRVHSRLTAMDTFIYNHQPHTLVEIPSQEGTAEIPSKNLPVHTFSLSFNSFCIILPFSSDWLRWRHLVTEELHCGKGTLSRCLSRHAVNVTVAAGKWFHLGQGVLDAAGSASMKRTFDILCTFDYILFIRVPANVNRFPRVCKWCAVAMRFSITAKCKDQETPMQLLHFVSPYITESLPSSQSNLISQR